MATDDPSRFRHGSPGNRTMPETRARYDGVRPRHATCPSCSYRIGGVPIEGGCLTCPECGTLINFELTAPPARLRPRSSLVIIVSLCFLAVAILAAGVFNSLAIFLLFGVAGVGGTLALIAVRRWCLA